MGSRATPLARLWGGWAWGCDEFTVGPGECDTHREVLCEEDGSGGCLPGGPRAGRPGVWGAERQLRGEGGEASEAGGPTAKLSWLGDWESEGGHFPELRNESVYSLRGRKCCEGALKSNVKSNGKVTGSDADVSRL